jgi:hypothetical protein
MMPMEQKVTEEFLELARLKASYHLFLSPQREVPKEPDRYTGGHTTSRQERADLQDIPTIRSRKHRFIESVHERRLEHIR